MEILNSLLSIDYGPSSTTDSENHPSPGSKSLPSVHSGREFLAVGADSHAKTSFAPDVKETASEMLPQPRKLGEFKDKEGLEETTDLHIGPDIRYALKSKNIDYLNRISWGPLTNAEFREVTHRIKELERNLVKSSNILKGKLINIDS